jgi:hypothetical protein
VWSKAKKSRAAEAPEFCRFLDEDAEVLRRALRRKDWPAARAILATADSEERSYYFSVAATTVGVERWIGGVVASDPDPLLPLLLCGAGLLTSAWDLRRDGLAGPISPAGAELWWRLVGQAEAYVEEVLRRDPGRADAWTWSIALSRALGLPAEERRRRFERLITIEPDNWYGHQQMLLALSPTWGGSSEAMFEFARARAEACPGTHVPALVVLAHREHNAHQAYLAKPDDPDRSIPLAYWESQAVMDEVWDAGQASFWHDDYEVSLLTPIVWNNFAYAFAYGDFHKPAWSLFTSIGDDWITRDPWGHTEFFVSSRDYTRGSLD